MSDHSNILDQFDTTSLEEMDSVKLLNRVDSKYLLSRTTFLSLFSSLQNEYKVLSIKQLRSARYKSLYFDTQQLTFYYDHHNGNPNRHKVRIRKYLDSNLCYFEVKHKHRGRTDKRRMRISDFELELSNGTKSFLDQKNKQWEGISATLWNSFERITLVNNERKERVTFDLNLEFSWNDRQQGFNDIVIAELKQEENNREAPLAKLFKSYGIRKKGFSKYCVGMGLIYNELKSNNFKQNYLLLNKLQNELV